VGAFQEAIWECQLHAESLALSTRAEDRLREAQQRDDSRTYALALFGFTEAYELWEENTRAKEGIAAASLAYAQSALRLGDYELGASLLDPNRPDHAEVLREIQAAQRASDVRQRRWETARRVGVGLLAAALAAVTTALLLMLAAGRGG
jgi:hypothetical protein